MNCPNNYDSNGNGTKLLGPCTKNVAEYNQAAAPWEDAITVRTRCDEKPSFMANADILSTNCADTIQPLTSSSGHQESRPRTSADPELVHLMRTVLKQLILDSKEIDEAPEPNNTFTQKSQPVLRGSRLEVKDVREV